MTKMTAKDRLLLIGIGIAAKVAQDETASPGLRLRAMEVLCPFVDGYGPPVRHWIPAIRPMGEEE